MKDIYKIGIILLALFILALGMRLNMVGEKGFFEPDDAWEMRMVKDVVLTGHVQNPDNSAYYQINPLPPQQENLLWNICAMIYQGTIGWWAGYNEEYFTKLMSILPAIFGALTCLIIYFIGRTVSNGNKAVGIVAMFVAAVTPGFLYRQMVGSQFTNASGFLAISLGIVFLMWAFNEKKISIKSIILAGLSGVCFLFSVLTWSFYLIIPLLLIAFWGYRALISISETKVMGTVYADILHFVIIITLFLCGCAIKQFDWISALSSFMGVPYLAMVALIVLTSIGGSLLMYLRPEISDENKKNAVSIIGICLILVVLGVGYFTTLNISAQDTSSTGSLVGEQSRGNQFFMQKYNIYNILIPLGLVGAIILFFWKGNKYEYMPMILAGFLITFVMGWLTLKFCYNLGFGISFAAIIVSILFYELWNLLKDKTKIELKILFIPSVIVLLMGISAAGVFVQDYNSALTSDPALQNVIEYFNTQTPIDSNILNGWNNGHTLSYFTHNNVSADNRNYSILANAQFATFENDSNVQKVYNMVKDIGANYILVQTDDFYGMQSNEFYIANKVDASIGIKFRDPLVNILDCVSDGVNLNCGGSGLLDISTRSTWTDKPTEFYSGTYPLFIYAIGNKAVVLNTAANNSNLAKVLVGTEETRRMYEKVFESGSYIILKVK
jgi:asparagine N-glycosylation enzyme membrane subunit Stt3